MNEQGTITGYICTAEERAFLRLFIPLGVILLPAFGIILWIEFAKSNGETALLAVAISWSVFVAYLFSYSYKLRNVCRMQFSIGPGKITNTWPPAGKTVVDLSGNLFVAKIPVEFGYGKAVATRNFYLFSSTPHMGDFVRGGGLYPLHQLSKRGIVIVPQIEETNAWIEEYLNPESIPDFPNNIAMPSVFPSCFLTFDYKE